MRLILGIPSGNHWLEGNEMKIFSAFYVAHSFIVKFLGWNSLFGWILRSLIFTNFRSSDSFVSSSLSPVFIELGPRTSNTLKPVGKQNLSIFPTSLLRPTASETLVGRSGSVFNKPSRWFWRSYSECLQPTALAYVHFWMELSETKSVQLKGFFSPPYWINRHQTTLLRKSMLL